MTFRYHKGESLKPTYNELQRIDSDYDPDQGYTNAKIEYLVAKAERPRRQG